MAKNPIAKALKSPHLAPKVVKSKKVYNRKIKHKEQIKGREYGALWRISDDDLGASYLQIPRT